MTEVLKIIKNSFHLRLEFGHFFARFGFTNFRFHSTSLQCNSLCHVPEENRNTDRLNRQKLYTEKAYKFFEARMARLMSRIFSKTTD